MLERSKKELETKFLEIESELLNTKTFKNKIESEKQKLQEDHLRLTEKHKALQNAMAQDALMDDTDVEASRKEFEDIIRRSQEIPQEVLKLKNEKGVLITQLNEHRDALAKYKTFSSQLREKFSQEHQEREQCQLQVKQMKCQYEQLQKIFQKRQQSYSELEHKHTALTKAVNEAFEDPATKQRVDAAYVMFVSKDELQQATLLKVQGIDLDLQRLERELNVQVGRVMELNEELEAKNKEIELLKSNDNKPQDIPVQQEQNHQPQPVLHQLDKEQLAQLISLREDKARLETSLKSHKDTIARLTNENSTLSLSETTLRDIVEVLKRDLSQSQAQLQMKEAHVRLHEAEKEMAKRTQDLIMREKDMVSLKLTELTAKFEEVQRDYLKAMKDSTVIASPSLERHEELRDLLAKITQEKDQLQRQILKSTDQHLILQTRLSDAQLIAENAREQLAKEKQCREELQKMISHFSQQQPKANEVVEEDKKVQNASALDKYERQCRDLEALLVQHEEEARQLLSSRDMIIDTLSASLNSISD